MDAPTPHLTAEVVAAAAMAGLAPGRAPGPAVAAAVAAAEGAARAPAPGRALAPGRRTAAPAPGPVQHAAAAGVARAPLTAAENPARVLPGTRMGTSAGLDRDPDHAPDRTKVAWLRCATLLGQCRVGRVCRLPWARQVLMSIGIFCATKLLLHVVSSCMTYYVAS